MNKYIEQILDNYEYPIINSLIFPNGEMLVLKSYYIGNKHQLKITCKSTIESYFEFNSSDSVSHFSVPTYKENEKYKVFAGEGSWGGDGIVFVLNKINDTPIWFLFLENSDPFDKVEFIESDVLLVTSTSDVKIQISIDDAFNMKSI